jgi:hypothetical protein
MAKSKVKDADGADKKSKKKAGKDKSSSGAADSGALSLAEHPRAVSHVKQAKELGGLGGFLVGGYLSLPTHTLADAASRALVAGVVCYVAVWAAAVFLWRRLVVAELRGRQHELLATELAKHSGPAIAGASAPEAERVRTRVAS